MNAISVPAPRMVDAPVTMPDAIEADFWNARYWEAVLDHDARMDGIFYYAVLSSGVYCRPSCPSRRPKRENVLFFRERQAAQRAGFRACLRCKPDVDRARDAQAELVERVCRHIEAHLDQPVTLGGLGREVGLSPFHLQRTFKATLGITPRGYADALRLESFQRGVRAGHSVTHSMYDAGYGSSSRLYERAASQLGMTPSRYRKQGAGEHIRYALADSPLGRMLVAATDRGVCAIRFGDSDRELESNLREEFSRGEVERSDSDLAAWVQSILSRIRGAKTEELPLDIRATAFQRLVWEHLRTIPRGAPQSYGEVAKSIGRPKASRAVARACASNPVAIAIPCHRVIRENGEPGGYRWGAERKQKLLELEATGRR